MFLLHNLLKSDSTIKETLLKTLIWKTIPPQTANISTRSVPRHMLLDIITRPKFSAVAISRLKSLTHHHKRIFKIFGLSSTTVTEHPQTLMLHPSGAPTFVEHPWIGKKSEMNFKMHVEKVNGKLRGSVRASPVDSLSVDPTWWSTIDNDSVDELTWADSKNKYLLILDLNSAEIRRWWKLVEINANKEGKLFPFSRLTFSMERN